MASGLKQRVITAILIGIPILLLVFYNNNSRLIFLALIALLANFEYLSFFYKKEGKIFMIISLALSAIVLFASYSYTSFSLYFCLASLLFSIILLWDLFYNLNLIHRSLPWFWAVAYITLPIAALISFHNSGIFSFLLISILLLIWVSDIGAYFVGKSMGKRKLFPRISPGKTWEGFFGAGALSLLASYIFFTVYDHFVLQVWALIALSTWLFGSMGDLVESKIKRAVEVKDSANFLPGHGGFLDRFDGFIFCLPFICTLILIVENLL